MDPLTLTCMAVLMGAAALLYSMVGHGGASAYLAIMALFAVAPEAMRPVALSLNLIVAGLALIRFWRAGQINLRLLALFVVPAAPAAFLGGGIDLPSEVYRPLVGIVLWAAAVRLFWHPAMLAKRPVRPPAPAVALPAGAALGLLAGVTGTGGGIFLSPLIVLLGWENARRTSGVAAGFIFINSAAGLAGNVQALGRLPPALPILAGAVAAGGLIGTWLGSRRLDKGRLLQGLGFVLVIAGGKLIFT